MIVAHSMFYTKWSRIKQHSSLTGFVFLLMVMAKTCNGEGPVNDANNFYGSTRVLT